MAQGSGNLAIPALEATGPGADQGRPAIRAAQALALPRPGGPTDISGMSVGIDLGGVSKWGVDHPIDKGSMSHRLALATQHAAWGLQWDQGVRWTGPLVTGATANAANRTVEVAFEPWSAGGLHLAGAAKQRLVRDNRCEQVRVVDRGDVIAHR